MKQCHKTVERWGELSLRGRRRRGAFALLAISLAWVFATGAATLPADWRHEQPFNVAAAGLVKLSLPVETLDAARPGLEDLRLCDETGAEVPYLIERPVPIGRVSQAAKSFQVALDPGSTVLTLETGLAQPLDGVTLETPAPDFIKPVRVEGSHDGKTWQTLVQGQPIFRQPNGASQLRVAFPAGKWGWLRLTLDDRRSPPVPLTGAHLHAATAEAAPVELLPAPIAERHENPGETRLTLNLGAANLEIASVQIETSEPLFTRQVTLAVPQVQEDAVREQAVGQGFIYRVGIEGQPASSNLAVALGSQIRSRELLLLMRNQDSPPLPVTAVGVERRPVYLVFLARQAGVCHLLTGNSRCPAPRYDLAALNLNLKDLPVSTIRLPPPADNPAYRAPEVLPGLEDNSTALDVTAWKFRKPVKLTRSGAQQLELDLDVLSHAQPGGQDLRLVHDGRQVPYILEHTSIRRALAPGVTATNDAKDPKLSRWIIRLPRAGLPVARLACAARTPLFQRELVLYEEVTDERGEKFRRTVGQASWVQTPNRANSEFVLTLEGSPQTDTLSLDTYNGDNPPIQLERFELFYPVSRVLFKAKADDELCLYYGNPRAAPPRYDLSLVANELLAADQAAASGGVEEQLKKASWREGQAGSGGMLFWGILAFVVVVLLIIIARLLPKSPPPPAPG